VALLLSHFDIEYAALYRNEGGMNFTDSSIVSGVARGTQGYVGWGDAFVDFSNGGWQDFFWSTSRLPAGRLRTQVDKISGAETPVLEPARRTFRNISKQVGPAIQTDK